MKRCFPGLHQTVETDSVPDGVYLARVEQVQYRWNAHKPFYTVRFQVLEPKLLAGRSIQARLYCTPKALWKLSWLGLSGVVQVSHVVVHGSSLLNLEAFAPATKWNDSPMRLSTSSHDSEVAS